MEAHGAIGSGAGAHEEAAWDEGPAGITFAEPVTTPTKDPNRHSSMGDLKPTLSRVESLSNSFIDDLESDLEGSFPGADEDAGGGNGGEGGGSGQRDVSGGGCGIEEEGCKAGKVEAEIEFALPLLPAQAEGEGAEGGNGSSSGRQAGEEEMVSAAAGVSWAALSSDAGGGNGSGRPGSSGGSDLPGIFDIALRTTAGSRASSMDVLHGSVLGGTSDVGSERGFCLGAAGLAAEPQSPAPPSHRPSPLGQGGCVEEGGAGGGWMGPLQG